MVKHDLQLAILSQLIQQPAGLRYSAMRPNETENDRYNYHLQALVKQGLVAKTADHYRLTAAGQRFILDHQPIDVINDRPIDKFKLAVLALVLRRVAGETEVLYQRRACQPFAGHCELIGGSLRKGEAVVEAARRRLAEESGLIGSFTLVGLIRKIRSDQTSQLYSDILYHICLATEPTGQLVAENQFGHNDWWPLERAIAHEQTARYGSQQLAKLFQAIQANQAYPLFCTEERYCQDIY